MDILDDMGVSNLSAKNFFLFFFLKVDYSFNLKTCLIEQNQCRTYCI